MKTRGVIINLALIVVLILLVTVGVIKPKANANGTLNFDNRARIVEIKPDGSTDLIILNDYFTLVNAKVAKVKIDGIEQKDPYFVVGQVSDKLDDIQVVFKTALGLKEYKVKLNLGNFIEFKVGENTIDIQCNDYVQRGIVPAGYDWFTDEAMTKPFDEAKAKEVRFLYGKPVK